jgi:hypothetical protein
MTATFEIVAHEYGGKVIETVKFNTLPDAMQELESMRNTSDPEFSFDLVKVMNNKREIVKSI